MSHRQAALPRPPALLACLLPLLLAALAASASSAAPQPRRLLQKQPGAAAAPTAPAAELAAAAAGWPFAACAHASLPPAERSLKAEGCGGLGEWCCCQASSAVLPVRLTTSLTPTRMHACKTYTQTTTTTKPCRFPAILAGNRPSQVQPLLPAWPILPAVPVLAAGRAGAVPAPHAVPGAAPGERWGTGQERGGLTRKGPAAA